MSALGQPLLSISDKPSNIYKLLSNLVILVGHLLKNEFSKGADFWNHFSNTILDLAEIIWQVWVNIAT